MRTARRSTRPGRSNGRRRSRSRRSRWRRPDEEKAMEISIWTIVKLLIVLGIAASMLHVHLRGRVRHGVLRQISDHSNFLAPMNAFMLLFSRVPRTPYLSPDLFPDLKPLTAQWQMIRDEAVAMQSAGAIK